MAQLKDLIVTGASRLIGDVYTSQIQISKIQAPTTASGTTYGAGSSGQALLSNGTTVYWGTPTSDISFDYGETLPSSASEGDIFFQLSSATNSDIKATKVMTTAATANSNYYLIGATAAGESVPFIATSNANAGNNTAGVYFNGSTGVLSGAAWNDYAEFREPKNIDVENIPYGRCVIENGDDSVSFSTKRLQPCGQIISDTYGFTLGTEENNLPIALCGRVLAYTYEPRKEFKVGDAVCTGPEGTLSKMTREEIKEYPDRIVGYVSSIPNYLYWGEANIEVKGRIWIKVK